MVNYEARARWPQILKSQLTWTCSSSELFQNYKRFSQKITADGLLPHLLKDDIIERQLGVALWLVLVIIARLRLFGVSFSQVSKNFRVEEPSPCFCRFVLFLRALLMEMKPRKIQIQKIRSEQRGRTMTGHYGFYGRFGSVAYECELYIKIYKNPAKWLLSSILVCLSTFLFIIYSTSTAVRISNISAAIVKQVKLKSQKTVGVWAVCRSLFDALPPSTSPSLTIPNVWKEFGLLNNIVSFAAIAGLTFSGYTTQPLTLV